MHAYERERTPHERIYRAAGAGTYQDAAPSQDPVSVRRSFYHTSFKTLPLPDVE